jgi:hypothetical protein
LNQESTENAAWHWRCLFCAFFAVGEPSASLLSFQVKSATQAHYSLVRTIKNYSLGIEAEPEGYRSEADQQQGLLPSAKV